MKYLLVNADDHTLDAAPRLALMRGWLRSWLGQIRVKEHMNLYQYSKDFYRIQLFMLSILAVVFLWVSRNQTLDFYLSDMWFDPVSNQGEIVNVL